MFYPESQEIIYDLISETPIKQNSAIYAYLSEHINIDDWRNRYNLLYQDFLKGKSNTIFDLYAEINVEMRDAIHKCNLKIKNNNIILLYWFNLFSFDAKDYFEKNKEGLTGKIIYAEENDYMNRLILLSGELVFPEL
jgi:hypothetical protein